MKKDKNISHQTRGGHTQNSTTVDVSKQISTSNNYALSAAASRPLVTSPDQSHKNRRIKMPTRLQLALNQARLDIQRNEKNNSALQKGAKKNASGESLSYSPHNLKEQQNQDVQKMMAAGKELQLLNTYRANRYDAQHQQYCEMKAVNDLVYNEPTHLVSVFKDFLILDDVNEFLKRPYTHAEQKSRLSRLILFYQRDMMTSQVYPGCMDARSYPYANYASLLPDPGHYIFKNIERRQRLRDQRDYLKRKNNMETDENEENASKNGEHRDANGKEKKKEKERASARLFDTQFMESVRLRHQNISQDDNQSFKFSSEADDARPSITPGLDGNQQTTIINQSLLSINQYSSNAMNLKKNQRGDGAVGEPGPKMTNRYSTRNIEGLIQEFIKRDSIMISDSNELNSSRQRNQALALGLPLQRHGERKSSNLQHYELRLNTEDCEALGKQYESMFKNPRDSIDTEQSASHTQRSIRVSAIMGDSAVPLPSSSVGNPFATLNKQTNNNKDNGGQKLAQSPLKSQRIIDKSGPFQNYQGQNQPERPGSIVGAMSVNSRKQRSRDVAANPQFFDQKKEIGPITVQISQPQKAQYRLEKSSKSQTTGLTMKQQVGISNKGVSQAETGSGTIAKKRKSFVAAPSKNETKSLNSVRNRNNLVRQGGTQSSLATQHQSKLNKLQATSPILQSNQPEPHRTPTVGSFNPSMMLLTSQKNLVGQGSSKSPSGLVTMNVFNPKKGETNAKRNSTSLKTNRQPISIKFDSYNPVNDLKDPNKVQETNTDFKQQTMPRIKSSLNSHNLLFFQGIESQNSNNNKMKRNEGDSQQDNKSDESDDTVKLEDFQEAQNNHYHKDIMEALKNHSKLSVINTNQQNVNSMLTYHHQHQNSQHSSIAQSIQLQTKQSQQIVDQGSQSIQSWYQQIPTNPPQNAPGRSSHHRNGGLIELGSNSSECNFDTRGVDQQSQMHPFVRAVISQPSGQVQRTSQFSQNKLQQSLNSLSSQDIQLVQTNSRPVTIAQAAPQTSKSNGSHQTIQPSGINGQKRIAGQARSMQRDMHTQGTSAKESNAQQIIISEPDEMLMPSKTLNHQQTQLLMPRIASQPKLQPANIDKFKPQSSNLMVDRYKTSQNGFDLYNKDMGGASIIPHKKIGNFLKNEGQFNNAAGLMHRNNKGSSQNLLTITSQHEPLTEDQLFQSQVKNDNTQQKLQTLPSNQEDSINAQILNTHNFQNRSRTRPQSRNYGQKSVTRSSVGGSAAVINHKKSVTQQQVNQKNFESRKASINRIQGIDNAKNNINRFGAKSQGNLHGARAAGPSQYAKSTIDPDQLAPKIQGSMQVSTKGAINLRRKSHNGKYNQPSSKNNLNNIEPNSAHFDRQMPQTSLASKSLQSLQKPQSMSRLKKSSHQQSPHIIKGLSSKQSATYENQRIKQRQVQSGHGKQIAGSASLSSKSGPILLSGMVQNQQIDFTSSMQQQSGAGQTNKQQMNRKTPQQSPMVDMQNKMHTRNKMRQTQTSIGTIQSLAAVPGSFGMHDMGSGGSTSSNLNQHQFSISKKQFGNTQPLKGLQILSSNYQITQMTQGPSEPSNFFQENQIQQDSHQKQSTMSGSNSKKVGTTPNTSSLNRNLSPTLNFQMIQRKDA